MNLGNNLKIGYDIHYTGRFQVINIQYALILYSFLNHVTITLNLNSTSFMGTCITSNIFIFIHIKHTNS
jgi:hypothetical protein